MDKIDANSNQIESFKIIPKIDINSTVNIQIYFKRLDS